MRHQILLAGSGNRFTNDPKGTQVISAVIFDLDETLLDRTTSLVAFLADQHARFADRLGEAPFNAWRDRFLVLDQRGYAHKSVVYPALLSEFGGDQKAAAALLQDYGIGCCRYARGFPSMAETLRALRDRNIRLGIVTNGETEFQTRHIKALDLPSLVDTILISEAEQLRKPDAALFRRAAERLGVIPARCLFVGDNPAVDVLGAHAAGMQTAWFSHGARWPDDLAPNPGVALNALGEVLDLTGIMKSASLHGGPQPAQPA